MLVSLYLMGVHLGGLGQCPFDLGVIMSFYYFIIVSFINGL